jgi:mono/diheme cytochrome c family protein
LNEPAEHRAQQREHAEPLEYSRPIPLVVAAVALAAVLFGAGYLLWSDSFGVAQYGDRRTLDDLSAVGSGRGGKADGPMLFRANCVACHQASGLGVPGVFPPLAGSEWVKGDPRVLANILLHGITGDLVVKGSSFSGTMPAFGHLSDADLAALATYIRNEWSNGAAAVATETIALERSSVVRTAPFAGGAELRALADSLSKRRD